VIPLHHDERSPVIRDIPLLEGAAFVFKRVKNTSGESALKKENNRVVTHFKLLNETKLADVEVK
jgi:hypothetical protein